MNAAFGVEHFARIGGKFFRQKLWGLRKNP
jgi:hypothetical protein